MKFTVDGKCVKLRNAETRCFARKRVFVRIQFYTGSGYVGCFLSLFKDGKVLLQSKGACALILTDGDCRPSPVVKDTVFCYTYPYKVALLLAAMNGGILERWLHGLCCRITWMRSDYPSYEDIREAVENN